MTPTKTKAILRRLADDWRHEEAKLCKQFGDVVLPQSMRARRIKDTEAIDAAAEMIDRLETAESEAVEQARLNGMGSEREAALMAKLEAAEKERDNANAAAAGVALHAGAMHARLGMVEKKRDALQAKIEAMERQEPVAWARKLAMDLPSFGCVTDLKYRPSHMPESVYMPLYALPGAAPEPSESEARMRWLLRQIVHALPSRRDWLDPAIEREARIATTPEANHDPR